MSSRYGTGELYGFDFCALSSARIRELSSAPYKSQPCPFKEAPPGKPAPRCNKKGGVCSLRLLKQGVDRLVEGHQRDQRGQTVLMIPLRSRGFFSKVFWAGKEPKLVS